MPVILSILQILSWIFLFLFCVILFLLLLILFDPIKYQMDVKWIDDKKAVFYAHWLFRAIRAKIVYYDDVITIKYFVFLKRNSYSFHLSEKKVDDLLNKKENRNSSENKKEKQGIISKIKGMIERIKIAYPKIKRIIVDEKNKDAVLTIKKEIIYLLKVLSPNKSKVDMIFSTGSPDTTGQAFGIFACFPSTYQKNWHIIPDFESDDFYMKGTIWGKGKIYVFKMISSILKILANKKCRRLFAMIKKLIRGLKINGNNLEEK